MSRQILYAELETERCCQDFKHGGPGNDDRLSEADWIAIACRQLGLAANDRAEDSPERFRRQMVRLAALAVAAVEANDRRHGIDKGRIVRPTDPGY